MVAEITAAIAGLKGLLDIAQGLKALKTDEEAAAVRMALTGEILNVQTTALDLVAAREADRERIAELERELERMRDWSEEKKSYRLVALAQASYAYVDGDRLEGPYLCTNCFEAGERSILQRIANEVRLRSLECLRCKSRVFFHGSGGVSVLDPPPSGDRAP